MECMFWVSGASKGCGQAYEKYVENRLIGQRVTLAVCRCMREVNKWIDEWVNKFFIDLFIKTYSFSIPSYERKFNMNLFTYSLIDSFTSKYISRKRV